MGEEKSARYTIILGVCLLLCLLMLGRMLVGRSESEAPPDGTEPVETVPEEQQEPQLSLVMTMSESDLANFLLQYLPFTPRGLAVSIGADETASMSMSVDRAELEESGLLTGHFRAAAQLLPERCSLAGEWGVQAEQGKLRFTCLSAQLNDADLPQTAAAAVAHHGVAQLCGRDQSQTVMSQTVFPAIEHHDGTHSRSALLVKPPKLIIFLQSDCCSHAFPCPFRLNAVQI